MKKILEYLASSLVAHPKKILVEEVEVDNYLNLVLKVHPDDVKIVIGKNGRTIKALRELLKIKAKEGKKVNIKVEAIS
jgi:hypothetical protein